MSSSNQLLEVAVNALDGDERHGVLSSSAYASDRELGQPRASKSPDKPTHYKVICISMYTDDLMRLDSMVDHLKARGLTKANRSALIRYALGEVNLDSVPKGL